MRNNINITNGTHEFKYVIEYYKGSYDDIGTLFGNVGWKLCDTEENTIHLSGVNVEYYRHKNDWYEYSGWENNTYMPESVIHSKVRIYIPNYCLSTYKRGVKYMLTTNTWVNGKKIDLGSYLFKPTDTFAVESGMLKYGDNEYSEAIDFYIIDPYYLTYSDDWADFRQNVCGERPNTNDTGSVLHVSLYPVIEHDNIYSIDHEYTGGLTSFNISDEADFLSVNLVHEKSVLKLNTYMNPVYSDLFEYLLETYDIDCIKDNINVNYELVIKDENGVMIGPAFEFTDDDVIISRSDFNTNFNSFFSTWDSYKEGWSFVASLNVKDGEYEMFSIVSNELPITQELFSRFVFDGSEEINLDEMNIQEVKVINKIENTIVKMDRPADPKSNLIHPVFFRVKDSELLTLHPNVTENICINLDDYKSKVKKFVLQIDGSRFNQIGSNNFGIIFKVPANKISKDVTTGVYYILNEELELVTSGKFNCVV